VQRPERCALANCTDFPYKKIEVVSTAPISAVPASTLFIRKAGAALLPVNSQLCM